MGFNSYGRRLLFVLIIGVLNSIEGKVQEVWAPNPLSDFLQYNNSHFRDFMKIPSQYMPQIFSQRVNDPDVDLTTPQMIARHGYDVESHTILTGDGYILTVHRIPRPKDAKMDNTKRQPVFLQHGLLSSSFDWVVSGPEKGLAFILADAGYDVWMGNVRGNTYSRAHVNYSISSNEFWNFSFHEIATYDITACIDYINKLTESEGDLIYIGHSMGTTVLFVLLSTKPEYNNKIKAGFAMAPAVYLTSVKSPIKILAPMADNIEFISRFFGSGEFLPQSYILKWLARFGCEYNNVEERICETSLFIICGFDEKQFNRTLMPAILNHTPAGASTKTVAHFAQEVHAGGRFQMYSFGKKENLIRYGTEDPPEYPIDKVTAPIALFSGENDWLTSMDSAKKLYKALPNGIEHYVVPYADFNHLDFTWGIDSPTLVYKKLMELMKDYKPANRISWMIRPNRFRLSWENN